MEVTTLAGPVVATPDLRVDDVVDPDLRRLRRMRTLNREATDFALRSRIAELSAMKLRDGSLESEVLADAHLVLDLRLVARAKGTSRQLTVAALRSPELCAAMARRGTRVQRRAAQRASARLAKESARAAA